MVDISSIVIVIAEYCKESCLPVKVFNMDAKSKGRVNRKSYEMKEKRNVVQQIDALVATGIRGRKACLHVGIPLLYYSRWKKLITKVDALNSSTEFVSFSTKGTSRKVHPGRVSVLLQVKQQLQDFVFKLRGQGVQVTNRMVLREARSLLSDFKNKSRRAQEFAVCRFTRSIGLTYRCATHTAQKHFKETQLESSNVIAIMRGRLVRRNKDDIINIDQTPTAYSFHARTTLEAKGTKTIQVRQPTQNMSLLQVRLGSTQNVSLLQRLSLPVARCCPLYDLHGSKQRAHCPLVNLARILQAESTHASPRHGWTKSICMHGSISS